MQKIFTTAALLFISAISASAQSGQSYLIRIIDAGRFSEPPRNLNSVDNKATYNAEITRHKHHDVVVLKRGGEYTVKYYQNEYDTMKTHQFMAASADRFDMAEYTWGKDTLNIRLFNSSTKEGKSYKGFGWGGTSSMKID